MKAPTLRIGWTQAEEKKPKSVDPEKTIVFIRLDLPISSDDGGALVSYWRIG